MISDYIEEYKTKPYIWGCKAIFNLIENTFVIGSILTFYNGYGKLPKN